jgi:endonuclease YncB( thermonuclease family)
MILRLLTRLTLALLLAAPALAAPGAAPPPARYTFARAELRGCADGDTCTFDLHETHPVFGTVTWRGHTVRFFGVDAPELHPARCEAERELGERAKARVVALLTGAATVSIEIVGRRRDKYGRLLGRVLADGRDVGALLIAEGLGRPYSGRGTRRPWCHAEAH